MNEWEAGRALVGFELQVELPSASSFDSSPRCGLRPILLWHHRAWIGYELDEGS